MKEKFKLEDLPKTNLYQVPDRYFDKLPGVIMERVITHKPGMKTNWLSNLFVTYRAAFASVFLLICFVATFLGSQNLPGNGSSGTKATLANINRTDALEYVLQQGEVDSRDIIELSLMDTDVTADFINLTPTDILENVDEQQLDEVYFN